MLQSGDAETRKLAGALAQACHDSLERTPLLEELLIQGPAARKPARTPEATRPDPGETAAAECIFASATAAGEQRLSSRPPRRRKQGAPFRAAAVGALLLLVSLAAAGAFLATRKPADSARTETGVAASERGLVLQAEDTVTLTAGHREKVMVRLERRGWHGPVELRLDRERLPRGVSAPPVRVASSDDTAVIELAATPLAVVGVTPLRLLAVAEGLQVERPLTLTVLPAPPPRALWLQALKAVTLEAGRSARVTVRLQRQRCPGPIELRLDGLPEGVRAQPVSVPIDADCAELELTAAADIMPQRVQVGLVAVAQHARAEDRLVVTLRGQEMVSSIGLRLVWSPAGKFWMGAPADEGGRNEDEVRHEVEITQPFFLGVHEVTQEEYTQLMGANPSHFSPAGKCRNQVADLDTRRFTVESVSWQDPQEFCRRLSALPEERKAGRVYRLPTEAQWEYACRAGTATPFSCGPSLAPEQANLKTSALGRTTTVSAYPANSWGLHDLHGNVWEWTDDWYGPYDRRRLADPLGPSNGTAHVFRGGSWVHTAGACRSAYRNSVQHNFPGDPYGGFRVICVLGGAER